MTGMGVCSADMSPRWCPLHSPSQTGAHARDAQCRSRLRLQAWHSLTCPAYEYNLGPQAGSPITHLGSTPAPAALHAASAEPAASAAGRPAWSPPSRAPSPCRALGPSRSLSGQPTPACSAPCRGPGAAAPAAQQGTLRVLDRRGGGGVGGRLTRWKSMHNMPTAPQQNRRNTLRVLDQQRGGAPQAAMREHAQHAHCPTTLYPAGHSMGN